MTVLVNPLHHYYRPTHLEHVIVEMRRRGSPVIRAYFDGELWHAREGTHRLRAAKALGLVPVLRPIPWWRSKASLERARLAAVLNAHEFPRVEIAKLLTDDPGPTRLRLMNIAMNKAEHTILSTIRGEGRLATEARIKDVCELVGIDDATREDAIGNLLDAGLIASTLIDSRALGHGYVPALRAL